MKSVTGAFGSRDTSRGLSAGFEYAGAVVLFLGLGILADNFFDSSPAFTIGGSVFGFIAGFARLAMAEKLDEARREALGLEPKAQREVPEHLSAKAAEKASTSMFGTSVSAVPRFGDWRPRKFGDPIPDELADDWTEVPTARLATEGGEV